jgi:hypothetical protein
MAWQYDLSDIAFDEAQEALGRHFRSQASITEWLKPAHLRALVRIIRDEKRRGTADPLALPGKFEADADRSMRIKRGVAHCREVLAPLMRELERRRAAEAGTLTPEEEIRSKAIERARRERREWSR